jgi:hypothetical protein
MATTRANFDTAKAKGEFGERIVRRWLEGRGFVVYKPETEGAHAFDALAIKDKERCIALDVKAKARRNLYKDTGISERHYQTYAKFSQRHKMPFWVVFVDEMQGTIYGNSLGALNEAKVVDGVTYPLNYNGTRFWPLQNMVPIHELSYQEQEELARLSQRNYAYAPGAAS